MNVSAFIRSYAQDFRYLEYCLRALKTRGQQFTEIVIAVPSDDYLELTSIQGIHARLKLIGVGEMNTRPYVDQQCCKLMAERFCNGDFVMFFDSDCIALREIKLIDFFDGVSLELPKLLFRKWEDAGTAEVWWDVTHWALKKEPIMEFMPSHPFLYHRSTLELFRRHMDTVHGKPFSAWASSLTEFSEFNALGNFCHLYTPDAYRFVRAGSPQDDYPRPFKQFWSRADVFPKDELESLMP